MEESRENTEYIFSKLVTITGANSERSEITLQNNTVYYNLFVHGFGSGTISEINSLNSELTMDIEFRNAKPESGQFIRVLVRENFNRFPDERQLTMKEYSN